MPNNNLWALTPDAVESFFNALQQEQAAQYRQPLAALPANTSNTLPPYALQQGVACIPIGGVIDRVARLSWSGQPYTAGQDHIRAAITAALNDPAVRSVLLCINSPGGVVAGIKELADFVAEAATIKPCAAYADGLCASAAYWLAAATGRVFAPVTASVGSIGVIAVITDWSSASEKYGVVRHIITGGKWKAAGHPDKAFTDEERQYFQAQISQLHSIFCADVARGMHITAAKESWGEGQLLLAEDASKVGLVTNIVRDVDMAVAALADMARQPKASGYLVQAKKEKIMNMEELKAQHPDLYAALLAEGKAQASADAAANLTAARESIMAVVKAVAGEELASRVSALVATGITPEQIAALAPMLAATKAESATALRTESATAFNAAAITEAQAREKALADITQATGGPLPGGAEVHKTHKSALVADAERRAVSGQQRM